MKAVDRPRRSTGAVQKGVLPGTWIVSTSPETDETLTVAAGSALEAYRKVHGGPPQDAATVLGKTVCDRTVLGDPRDAILFGMESAGKIVSKRPTLPATSTAMPAPTPPRRPVHILDCYTMAPSSTPPAPPEGLVTCVPRKWEPAESVPATWESARSSWWDRIVAAILALLPWRRP